MYPIDIDLIKTLSPLGYILSKTPIENELTMQLSTGIVITFLTPKLKLLINGIILSQHKPVNN